MMQAEYSETSTGRMPRALIWAMLTICAAPFLLNIVGVDFGSSKPGFPWADVPNMAPHERVDAAFHMLSGSFTHTLLEWTAFLTAIFTLLLAYLHFTISRDITAPILGMALFCAGVMDAFHTLAADRLIEAVADNSNLIPFTWAISRIFNALILIIGVGIFMYSGTKNLKGDLRLVLGISAGFLILAYAIITYCANSAVLPQTMYPDSLITRPYDVVPLILFSVAGLTLFRWFYQQRPGIFTHALLLSMVPDVVVELHMAFGSTALFDNHFNIAHFIKIFAYLVPFLGLALDYVWTYKKMNEEMAGRKEAEAAQAESETRMRAIVETAADSIISIQDNGMLEFFNPGAERMFGYQAKEVIGQNVNMLMPSPYQEEHDGYLQAYMSTHIAKVIGKGREVVGQRKDGTTFPMWLSVGEMKLGDARFFTGMCRDMTEEKRIREELEQRNTTLNQEHKLKTELGKIWTLTQEAKNVSSLAQSVISVLAKAVEAGHGAFFVREDRQGKEQAHMLILEGSYAFRERKHVTTRLQYGEGLVGQCAREKEPILLTQVPPDYVRINSGLGEQAPMNILVVPILFDQEVLGVIELASFHLFTPAQNTYLTRTAEILGVVINSVAGHQRTEALLRTSQSLTEELQTQQEELQAANEELTERAQELKASEEALKCQSEELRASNEELEEKSKALTWQKADVERKNIDLESARQELERKAAEIELASKYKSEFLANMSHELRTPLNSLLILAQSLVDNEEGNLTEDQVEASKVIYGGGKDLLTLINDILDLSKVEAGKLQIAIEEVSLEAVFANLQRQFNPLATTQGLEFLAGTDPDCPRSFPSDVQRVEQILKNLLSNACKFTKAGSITLKAHRAEAGIQFQHPGLTPDRVVAFSVCDTGIGISEEKQQAIFEAFQQADGSTSRNYGGTGLGLTISRQLCRLLGGELQVVSQLGQGSTFTLYLPLDPPVVPDRDPTTQTRTMSTSSSRGGSDVDTRARGHRQAHQSSLPVFIPDDRDKMGPGVKSVLIIEDDATFAKTLMALARKKGYTCLVAGEGRPGLAFAEEYQPDAILLDLGLPDIDGQMVLTQLKHNRDTSHIPVHVLSGRDENSALFEVGALGHLTKPANPESLDVVFAKIEATEQRPVQDVLVIDNDKTNRQAITQLIQKKGRNVVEARDGQEACGLYHTCSFDCLIMDLSLPDMTGVELLDTLSVQNTQSIPPLIIYTAKDLTEEDNRTLCQYTASVVIKGMHSPERLLDEVSLFLHERERRESTIPGATVPSLSDSNETLLGRKVLLVDDDLRNMFALSRSLQKQGVDVKIADNGQMALETLRADPGIDLVLMDIMMPVMDGYEAMRRIRQDARWQQLPIIALTAKAMPEDQGKCLEAGANDYLAKPVDVAQLISLMRVWLFEKSHA